MYLKAVSITAFSSVIMLFSTIIFAFEGENQWGYFNEWNGVGFSQAYITYPDKSHVSFQAVIDDDPDGTQIVEFRFIDSRDDKCIGRRVSLSDMVMKINDKRVRMKVGCKRAAVVGYVLRYFATSIEGRKHIVESFKTGLPVPVRIQGYDVMLPSKGFSEVWKEFGGDAL
jgi:hypothetical protein